jgi:DNA-binding NarL/FixJ family response regulator
MESPIRVLLVEDEPLWQVGVEGLLASDSRFELVGVADDYDAALKTFAERHPQVVLLDWKIKGDRDGLAVGNRLLNEGVPPERIVLISGSEPTSIPPHPFLFVPKSRIASELLPLLESVTIN